KKSLTIATRTRRPSVAAERDDRVVAAETERVAESENVAVKCARLGHDVQWNLGVLLGEVDRWGRCAVVEGKDREDAFHGAGTAQKVAGGGFRRRHGNVGGVVAEDPQESLVFSDVARRGA